MAAGLALSACLSLSTNAFAQGKPDMIVRTDILERQWVVREEKLDANYCSVIEGGVQPGLRKLVRFTVQTANVGDTDLFVGDPQVHYNANDGLFELVMLEDHGLLHSLVSLGKVYRGAHLGDPLIRSLPVTRVAAEPVGSEPVLLEVDGETPGRLPAEFEILPGLLNFQG